MAVNRDRFAKRNDVLLECVDNLLRESICIPFAAIDNSLEAQLMHLGLFEVGGEIADLFEDC